MAEKVGPRCLRFLYQTVNTKVGVKVSFPEKRDIGISYCRLLLHDTMLKDDSYQTGTSETPICECSFERESSEHFLLQCSRY